MSDKEISITELRAHLYETIDRMMETGEPQLLSRKGRRIRLYARPDRQPRPRRRPAQNAQKRVVVNDLSKLTKPKRSALTEPLEWYISPRLDEWDPDNDLS